MLEFARLLSSAVGVVAIFLVISAILLVLLVIASLTRKRPLRLASLFYVDDDNVWCFHCRAKMDLICSEELIEFATRKRHPVYVYRCPCCNREVTIKQEEGPDE